jgi:hypothetical protein
LLALISAVPGRAGAPPASGAVAVEMRNVAYHFTGSIAVGIVRLRGALVPARTGEVPVFDDKRSFELKIDAAEIHMSLASLANVLNQQVFAARDAPLKQLTIQSDGGRLKIKGRLHDRGDVGFEMQGSLSATPDGRMRLHAEKIKALHLPLKGLLDLFGVKIANLINTSKVRGIRAEGNDLILDPEQILPPPQIRGRVTAVEVRANEIVQRFGDDKGDPKPSFPGNYMAYRGNRLRFGKLTMENTDMVLIDMDPRDAFDFFLDQYQRQLTAGYTRITPEFGLRVNMRDFNKLPRVATSARKSR